MNAAEWFNRLNVSKTSGVNFVYAYESDIQRILDDGRVQGMREAAKVAEDLTICPWIVHYEIRRHADKLEKGEK